MFKKLVHEALSLGEMNEEGVDIIFGGATNPREDVAGITGIGFLHSSATLLSVESEMFPHGVPEEEDARGSKGNEGEEGPEGAQLSSASLMARLTHALTWARVDWSFIIMTRVASMRS